MIPEQAVEDSGESPPLVDAGGIEIIVPTDGGGSSKGKGYAVIVVNRCDDPLPHKPNHCH